MIETRYFILDCQDIIVGNHKGYNTMKGARIALNRDNKKLKSLLINRAEEYNLFCIIGCKPQTMTVYKIKALPVVNIETIKG